MRGLVVSVVVLLMGLVFYMKYGGGGAGREGLTPKPSCPNMLIQKGSRVYLYNTSLAHIPGVNPVSFENLDEYVQFTKWQRSQGIECPALFMQHSYDAQGNPSYRLRPSIQDQQGGLPPSLPVIPPAQPTTLLYDAGRDDPPFNQSGYPSYDQQNQYVGLYTPLDAMAHAGGVSDMPTDPNWGGPAKTQSDVDSGSYDADKVWVRAGRDGS